MIECARCEKYFKADEIESCPECDAELCEECFQIHVKKCLNSNDEDEEDFDEEDFDEEDFDDEGFN